MNIIDYGYVKSNWRQRSETAHKGDFGRALLVAGSYGMAGAAAIAGEAAVKSGVGICHIFCPQSIYPIIAPILREAVYTPYGEDYEQQLADDLQKSDCVVIGCGMGKSTYTAQKLRFVLNNSCVPVIIDADGLNCLSDDLGVLGSVAAPVILTPHLGEMSRLCGLKTDDIIKNRAEISRRFSAKHNVILVLKGHDTLVTSPDGTQFVNTSGNAGMATGGSGDMLCGVMAALCCRMPAYQAACCAVYIHGAAGDVAAFEYSQTSVCPSLMMKTLPIIYKKLETD